jgi:hypothetical protein
MSISNCSVIGFFVLPTLTPAPWTTVDCEIDLRPGGIFRTVMRSPEGFHDGWSAALDQLITLAKTM